MVCGIKKKSKSRKRIKCEEEDKLLSLWPVLYTANGFEN